MAQKVFYNCKEVMQDMEVDERKFLQTINHLAKKDRAPINH